MWDDVHVAQPKERSRRFPTKVMYMGIVAPPVPEHDFDGKIMIKRVSKKQKTNKVSHNQRFHDCYIINNDLKNGEWKTLYYSTGYSVALLFHNISMTYGLDAEIAENLVLSYDTYPGTTKTIVRLNATDAKQDMLDRTLREKGTNMERKLTLDDVTLYVHQPAGTETEVDVSCDSAFMASVTDEIGTQIRAKFHWVPLITSITLFMDNAGGHGTDEAKATYVRILIQKYNIVIEWQIPNSPDTNLLDLGAWVTIQSVVEWLHRDKRLDSDVLAQSVLEAWEQFDSEKLANVAKRWIKVLDLIIKGAGSNDFDGEVKADENVDDSDDDDLSLGFMAI